VNTHIRPANWLFRDVKLRMCYQLRWVVFRAEVASGLESALESAIWVGWAEVHVFLCISSMSADYLWYHFGEAGTQTCGFVKHSRAFFYRSLHLVVPRKLNTHFFSSQTLARGYLHRYCVSSIVACEHRRVAILAIFKARRMPDCSSSTRPPLAKCILVTRSLQECLRGFGV